MKAALFDLDGTLLDSMHVWLKVDEEFFQARGIDLPDDYARAISGMSFLMTAQYTKQRFSLPESAEAIGEEWTQLAAREYAEHVLLKPGSLEFLSALRSRGVRMAVVTALHRGLYEPCLVRNGVMSFFEFCMSTDEAGGASKRDGLLYRMAAQRLGVPCADCAVFEDVYEGILGAKSLGMRAYCIVDPTSTHNLPEIMSIADGCARDIRDLGEFHTE